MAHTQYIHCRRQVQRNKGIRTELKPRVRLQRIPYDRRPLGGANGRYASRVKLGLHGASTLLPGGKIKGEKKQ